MNAPPVIAKPPKINNDRMTLRLVGSAVSAAILLFFAACAFLVKQIGQISPMPVAEQKLADDRRSAYAEAEVFCREHLKAPSTARFSTASTSPLGSNCWYVCGSVDSQNSYGAMLREKWIAIVRQDGSQFHTDFVKIGDQTYGIMPAEMPVTNLTQNP
jgi:hypothetical protein